MQGVTTAIVAFLFVCIVFPSLVKIRAQWYAALALVLVIILLDGVAVAIGLGGAGRGVVYGFVALLQIGTIALLVLACGGLTPRELAADMKRAYEVIRRGSEEKEIIIPRENPAAGSEQEEGRVVYAIDTPVLKVPAEKKEDEKGDRGPLPMDEP